MSGSSTGVLQTLCKQNPSQPYTPENDMDVHKLSAQLTIINRDNIHSIGELEGKIDKLKKEYDLAVRVLNKLSLQSEKLSELEKQAEFYFTTKERGEPFSEFEKLQMNMCGTVLEHNRSFRGNCLCCSHFQMQLL